MSQTKRFMPASEGVLRASSSDWLEKVLITRPLGSVNSNLISFSGFWSR